MGAITFDISLAFYFCAMLFALLDLFKGAKMLPKLMLLSALLGFGFHTIYIFYSGFSSGYVPIVNPHEATSFFAWCIFLLFFVLEYRYKLGLLGSFITPLAFALMFVSFILPAEMKPLPPILRSQWLGIHAVFAFLANAAFAMAAGVGVMYLVQEHYVKSKNLGGLFSRLPSLHVLDEINYRLITIGFPLFTVAIISGSIWADNAWGSYISWEPRQVWSIISWLIFGIVLHARLLAGWRGRRAAVLSILGFLTIIGAFAGLALLHKGQHVFL
ncbi:MAG: c-type cytochrome biogenesis protein CcsB [Nitrospiraceae bacterium]|nr:c-type cytochrome biogenesis protein CcsB [Nitrospiraceae bacterium]